MTLKTNNSQITTKSDARIYVANKINQYLDADKVVVWFVSGGSNISLATEIRNALHVDSYPGALHVCLVDERYGPEGHMDSNWQALLSSGFDPTGCAMHPVLTKTKPIDITTRDYAEMVNTLLNETNFSIGLFGMGVDGHTAGLLPYNPVMESHTLYDYYEAKDFKRITATPRLIHALDDVVLYAASSDKIEAMKMFMANGPISSIPARLLKDVNKLSVFTDIEGVRI